MVFDRRIRAALAALLLTFMSTFALGTVDRAICTTADAGVTCSGAEVITSTNEEIVALDKRARKLLNTVVGTNTITASVTPTLTLYSDGDLYRLIPANNNSGAVTLNIDTIGAKAVVDTTGTALSTGALLTTGSYLLEYISASDHFRVINSLGNTVGAASSTDNAIVRFDGTGGKIIQNSAVTIGDDGEVILEVGDADDAPLKLQVGTNLTTAEVGAVEMDANNIYGTTDAANRGIVPLRHFIRQDSTRTFTSNTSEQAIFDEVTNGRLTLEAGTYRFDCSVTMTSMSATSGNASFDILGAGTSTITGVFYSLRGIDGATATAASETSSYMVLAQTPTSAVTAGIGTSMQYSAEGTFETTAGTIIPSMTLVTAAAAVIGIGSYCGFERLGSDTVTNVGQWD